MTTPKANPSPAPADFSPETIIVDQDVDEVSCDGGGGALGHPVVWYSFDGLSKVTCGYCDREFVKRAS